MMDQIYELSRKAAESSLQMQQAMFKHWTQDLPSHSPMAAALSADWPGSMRKRWIDLTLEALNKHRESLDAMYKTALQTLEKSFRISEALSSEEFVRAISAVWQNLFEALKSQSEAQFQEFQSLAEKFLDMARKTDA